MSIFLVPARRSQLLGSRSSLLASWFQVVALSFLVLGHRSQLPGSRSSFSAFLVSRFQVINLTFLVPGHHSQLTGWKSQIKVSKPYSSGINQTPLQPIKSNGQVEFANKIVLRGLKTRVLVAHSNWVDELNKVLWSCGTTPSLASGETPFSLAYGAEAVIPVEVGLPSDRASWHNDLNNEQLLRENLDLVEEVREMSQIRNMAHQSGVTNAYSHMGKLAPNWEEVELEVPSSTTNYREFKHLQPRSAMSFRGRARSAELKHELLRSNTSCRAQTLAAESSNTCCQGQARSAELEHERLRYLHAFALLQKIPYDFGHCLLPRLRPTVTQHHTFHFGSGHSDPTSHVTLWLRPQLPSVTCFTSAPAIVTQRHTFHFGLGHSDLGSHALLRLQPQ
ncbi:hypothetical protein SLEP1_g30349 [Rubroshorea leprosula]|uniref:Uncharacterized protein n=1 Tax=Rubroshorea leprosula TaxID=152421 RepID=A0AAV5K5Z8_9ROSI|nr:hypothetical protein SLEP1_g30349 [Rubroshorea leprosula]